MYDRVIQYNLQANMKEDSLLSSLSNLSYQANPLHIDFFNDSSPALGTGGYPETKLKPQFDQQQVDLNCLPQLANNEPPSPKHNGLLLAYWTGFNNMAQGNSDIGQSEIEEQHEMKTEQAVVKIQQQVEKVEEPIIKIQQASDEIENEQIGTVIKNQTKNIPKNYGKAIITYIQKQKQNFEYILQANGVEYEDLLTELSKKKKFINTIANLRDLWVDFKYAKCMRILSNQFLRKYALQYIFNSRICNYTSHVKYRKRLQEAIQAPGTFRHIKQY